LREPSLRAACEATLLFHSGSPWTEEKQREWERLTGDVSHQVTTKRLCDFIRSTLAADDPLLAMLQELTADYEREHCNGHCVAPAEGRDFCTHAGWHETDPESYDIWKRASELIQASHEFPSPERSSNA